MSRFIHAIGPHVDIELDAATLAETAGDAPLAFRHLQRAHVLGQASTVQHVRVHLRMLLWAWRQRQPREWFGQLLRIGGAATKTAVGLVPIGNTGGSDVSPFRTMPVPDDLAWRIRQAGRKA